MAIATPDTAGAVSNRDGVVPSMGGLINQAGQAAGMKVTR